ncbi:MAG: cell division protein ZapB [Acidobacteria bacterium]|nr:cell division protein ZapB [Acidobacteriota bacterium]
MSTATVSVDEFQALEQRVQRAVELIKTEREARAAAEAEVKRLREELEENAAQASTLQVELAGLKQERESVKGRVDAMLKQMDELL